MKERERERTKERMQQEVKVVLFDVDKTLYDSPELSNQFGLEVNKMVAEKQGWDAKKAEIEYEKKLKEKITNTKALEFFEIEVTDLWDRLNFSEYINPDRKLVEMVNGFSQKYRLGIISNGNRRDQVGEKLRLIGISPEIFKIIVPTVELGKPKPDPYALEHTMKQLKVSNNKEIVFIGDSEDKDIGFAQNFDGMWSIRVGGSKETKADFLVKDIYGVGELFSS